MKNLQKGFVASALLVIIALLVIGGGVYVYEKKSKTPAVVDTGTQQSNQNQQQTNTQNQKPVTKTDLKPQPQITNLDCGTVLGENLFAKPENRSVSEKNSLECFAKAIFSCQTASLKVSGNDDGVFEIVKKEGGNCVIKSKASEMKQCAVPMDVIVDLKTYAETQNLFIGDVIAPLSFMIAFEQGKNNQTGESIKLSCANL